MIAKIVVECKSCLTTVEKQLDWDELSASTFGRQTEAERRRLFFDGVMQLPDGWCATDSDVFCPEHAHLAGCA